MSDTFWIIGEIIVGIAFLGLLTAVVTVMMVRVLSKPPEAREILDRRYAMGELSREEYTRMQLDMEGGTGASRGWDARPADASAAVITPGPRTDR